MEWNEETISRLRNLWQEGHSTAEIGRRMSITKNAVVGKAHRLTLPPRPSPIRKGLTGVPGGSAMPRGADGARATAASRQASGRIEASRPASAQHPAPPSPVRLTAQPSAGQAGGYTMQSAEGRSNVTPIRRPAAALEPRQTTREAAPEHDHGSYRSLGRPEPRRRGLACCWPLGEPGTKHFRFCGGDPIPGKPYCTEHAQLAYVKLRDRRDTA